MSMSRASSRPYEAKLRGPVCTFGVRANEAAVTEITFLPSSEGERAPANRLAAEACRQIEAYLADAGFRFDLPIALGILAASGQVPGAALQGYEFAGELSLTGELRPVRGALAMALGTSDSGRAFVLPAANADQAALATRARVGAEEAERLSHKHIGTEHLLLGLVREGEGIAAGVLESLGVNLDKVRHEVIRVLSQSSAAAPAQETKRASKTPTVDQLGINHSLYKNWPDGQIWPPGKGC